MTVPNDGDELRPATREELVEGLAFAMRHQGRKRVRDDHADSFMSRVAAERLTDYMDQSGFVVMKKPPAAAPSTTRHMPPLKD